MMVLAVRGIVGGLAMQLFSILQLGEPNLASNRFQSHKAAGHCWTLKLFCFLFGVLLILLLHVCSCNVTGSVTLKGRF